TTPSALSKVASQHFFGAQPPLLWRRGLCSILSHLPQLKHCGYASINAAKRISTQPEPHVHRRHLFGLFEESIIGVTGLAYLFSVVVRNGGQWFAGHRKTRRRPAGTGRPAHSQLPRARPYGSAPGSAEYFASHAA